MGATVRPLFTGGTGPLLTDLSRLAPLAVIYGPAGCNLWFGGAVMYATIGFTAEITAGPLLTGFSRLAPR